MGPPLAFSGAAVPSPRLSGLVRCPVGESPIIWTDVCVLVVSLVILASKIRNERVA